MMWRKARRSRGQGEGRFLNRLTSKLLCSEERMSPFMPGGERKINTMERWLSGLLSKELGWEKGQFVKK